MTLEDQSKLQSKILEELQKTRMEYKGLLNNRGMKTFMNSWFRPAVNKHLKVLQTFGLKLEQYAFSQGVLGILEAFKKEIEIQANATDEKLLALAEEMVNDALIKEAQEEELNGMDA